MNRQTKQRRPEPHRIAFKAPVNVVRFRRLGLGARARRFGELAAACALIAFTLPLMAIVAIAIKCEGPGPVFERQPRIGSGGRRFDALRFRTTLHAVEDAGRAWHRAPQMTRMGPHLRYTRIDDLPQLFNVLRGEMSIIGTGAYAPSLLD
jgi:lipopolysaccharide/colanic/teichoic acid biosynthesis glycosyltransferase